MERKERGRREWQRGRVAECRQVILQEKILTFADDGDNPHLVMTPRAIASD